jgi:hypothetical protein
MNKGISLSKGSWLYFLGTDDQLFDKTTFFTIFSKQIADKTKLIIGRIMYDLKKEDIIYTHNKGLIIPSWSKKLWIKNSIHHQGAFYKRELFTNHKYDLKYSILADYALNLHLYKKKVKVKVIDVIIALCGTDGVSKKHHWNMYKEEINLKVNESSNLFKPMFITIAYFKYLLKKAKFI